MPKNHPKIAKNRLKMAKMIFMLLNCLPAVRPRGHGAAAALEAPAAAASAAAAALLVQELPRHLEPGRRQEPVALPARVDPHE